MRSNRPQTGMSLLELLVVVTLLGIVTAVFLPRVFSNNESANVAACHVYKGDIEIQAELWIHNTGSFPAANLATIGADTDYFPDGLPLCPVDGTAYTIDPTTGLVIGHTH